MKKPKAGPRNSKALTKSQPVRGLSVHVLKDRVIQQLTAAEKGLAAAVTIDQVKLLLDVGAAQEVFATRQKLGEDVIAHAHALKIHAMARLGELLKRLEKRGPQHSRGGGSKGSQRDPLPDAPPTLAELGVSKKVARQAQLLAELPPQTQEAVAQREAKLGQVVRKKRHEDARQHARDLPTPEGLFDTIAIDPPWRYDRQPKDSDLRGECDYATMSIEELKALVLPAAPDCVLWLWTTNSFMGEAYQLLDAWGFTAKTILTWDKVNLGLGEWLRNVTEHCILAVRGRPVVTLTNQTTLIREPRREHSRKPEAFYALVESLCPGRKYEHFSRTPRPGWTGYGLESDAFAAEEAQ